MIFYLLAPKIYLIILASQSFDYERSWWSLFQKPVLRTKLDIYDCFKTNEQSFEGNNKWWLA